MGTRTRGSVGSSRGRGTARRFGTGRIKGGGIGIVLATTAVLLGATACGAGASASGAATGAASGAGAGTTTRTAHTASPKPSRPAGPPMLLNTITPQTGTTVGVAMPVSVNFTDPVATSARAGIEKHLKLTTSVPVNGAWHWFGDQRVDWRPASYWPSGTKVTLDAELTGVTDGHGRYGTHAYHHSFTVGSDTQVTVSAPGHTMKVSRDGKVVRTLPIDAGSKSWPSWDGTMAVMGKAKTVRMTSCSVNITCDKKSPDYYDLTLPWDVQLTSSGTYIHYSTGDPYPGHSSGSHGCVHLSLADAKWFYDYVKQGDPVTITGSPRGNAAGDNGYADFNLTWSQWLAQSATGAHATSVAL
ncbi:L,D-transpeptidase [Streptomyces liangshanensis]|uniref:L,D-transpeptidase n=1 Tax=Streptomyces liangshanensis TaxID=2717324 RepID=A0A6G9GWC9_9ACTN|nr:L,D-transpeptidase [Streptomyces liangshanensis]QIQ02568.1 L,D-transpeptidase [Streptomyces liangshanensis]